MERTVSPETCIATNTHLTCLTGPIKVSYVTGWSDVHGKMLDAVENIGIPRNPEAVCNMRFTKVLADVST